MTLLEVSRINVFYGDFHILRDVSIIINKGEIVSIVGANGAGKSTLLKAISGLIMIENGYIRVDGIEIQNLPSHLIVRKGVVHVMEGRRLFPHMTIIENLKLGGYSRPKEELEKNLGIVFELFPILKERRNQLARTFSGGEQQMLAIARGLMAEPKIIMLDEPSLGLSPLLFRDIYLKLSEINKYGKTILLVEQDVQKSLSLSARGYLLENGEITLEGNAQDLLNNNYLKKAYLALFRPIDAKCE